MCFLTPLNPTRSNLELEAAARIAQWGHRSRDLIQHCHIGRCKI